MNFQHSTSTPVRMNGEKSERKRGDTATLTSLQMYTSLSTNFIYQLWEMARPRKTAFERVVSLLVCLKKFLHKQNHHRTNKINLYPQLKYTRIISIHPIIKLLNSSKHKLTSFWLQKKILSTSFVTKSHTFNNELIFSLVFFCCQRPYRSFSCCFSHPSPVTTINWALAFPYIHHTEATFPCSS